MSRFAARHGCLWRTLVVVVLYLGAGVVGRWLDKLPGPTLRMEQTAVVGRRGDVLVTAGRVSGYVGDLGRGVSVSPDGPPASPKRTPWRSSGVPAVPHAHWALGDWIGGASLEDLDRDQWGLGGGTVTVTWYPSGRDTVDCSGVWFVLPEGLEYGSTVAEARAAMARTCRVGRFEAGGKGPRDSGRFRLEPSIEAKVSARGRIARFTHPEGTAASGSLLPGETVRQLGKLWGPAWTYSAQRRGPRLVNGLHVALWAGVLLSWASGWLMPLPWRCVLFSLGAALWCAVYWAVGFAFGNMRMGAWTLDATMWSYTPVLAATGSAWLIARDCHRHPSVLWHMAAPIAVGVVVDMALWLDWPGLYAPVTAAMVIVAAQLIGLSTVGEREAAASAGDCSPTMAAEAAAPTARD